LSIIDGKKTFDINGDRFRPGLSISNSEVGLSSLSIAAFVLRLICTNRLCVDLDYQGSTRRIEPYSLRRTKGENIILHAWNVRRRRTSLWCIESPWDHQFKNKSGSGKPPRPAFFLNELASCSLKHFTAGLENLVR